jgi:hypothetical protein
MTDDPTIPVDSGHVDPVVPDWKAGKNVTFEDVEAPKRASGDARTKPRGSQRRTPKPAPAYPPGGYADRIEEVYDGMALMFMPFEPEVAMYLAMPEQKRVRDMETGDVSIVEGVTGSRKCAEAWDKAAQRSPAVRRLIEGFLTVNVWGALITAHAPIIVTILKNRTSFGEKMDPATAMEAMLKRTQAAGGEE